jgi:parvulin-like peptidyl-prolyl isomerase
MSFPIRLLSLVLVAACGSQDPAPDPRTRPVAVPTALRPDHTERVVDLDMIWISHREVDASQTPLDQAAATRARAEAKQLATDARARIAADPSAFAETARKLSDDRISRQFGGALGTTPIGAMPHELADAVAALAPDELSPVLDTKAGYYLMRRRHDTPNVRLSAATVFVTWTGSDSLVTPSEPRTRDEALALAAAARAAALASPTFGAIVQELSDDRERARQDGWEGVWSSVAFPLENYPYLTQATLALDVGAISPVIEGRDGFYIVQRLPLVEPPTFAATEIVVAFRDARLADAARPTTRTRDEALVFARQLADRVRSQPARFDAEVTSSSDSPTAHDGGKRQWTKGRMLAAVDAAIEVAAVGDIVGPIETPLGFAILRRD